MLSLAPSLSLAHASDPVSEYATRRLVCWSETRYASTTTLGDDGNLYTSGGEYETWGVRDGRGQQVSTDRFAALVGDHDLITDLQARADAGRKRGRGLLLGGAIASGAGLGGMILGGKTQAYPIIAGSSLALAGGAAAAGYGLLSASSAQAPLEYVPLAYERGLANQRCEAYNDRLRAELGLTAEQTRAIDTAWTLPPRSNPLTIRPLVTVASLGITGTF